MVVGSNCIHNFKEGLKILDFDLDIKYPSKYEQIAKRINNKFPGTVIIMDEYGHEIEVLDDQNYDNELEMELLSLGELTPEGTGPDEIDWDSFDFDGD